MRQTVHCDDTNLFPLVEIVHMNYHYILYSFSHIYMCGFGYNNLLLSSHNNRSFMNIIHMTGDAL